MGMYSSSLYLFDGNQQTVVNVYEKHLSSHRAFISPRMGKWVTVFDEEFEPDVIPEETASAICRYCQCSGIGIAVARSNFLCYWAFDARGALIDKSAPADSSNPTGAEQRGLAGNPASIAEVVGVPEMATEFVDALEENPIIDDAFWTLQFRLELDYGGVTYEEIVTDPEDCGMSYWPGWSDFVHVGGPSPVDIKAE